MRKFVLKMRVTIAIELDKIRSSFDLSLVWITICPDLQCFENNPDVDSLINLANRKSQKPKLGEEYFVGIS